MPENPPPLCPHCGQTLPNSRPLGERADLTEGAGSAPPVLLCSSGNISDSADPIASGIEASESPAEEIREYDHRGIQLPRRTRVGGIIIPQ